MMTYFAIVFLVFVLTILILVVGWSIKNGIGPMPTSPKTKNLLLKHLPNDHKGIIYELGSGWGTLAFPLARKYLHTTVIAYENSPIPYLYSKFYLLLSGEKNLLFKRENFFSVNLKEATIVVCYLYPGAMQRLKVKFEQELLPGTRVVSHTFAIPGWKAEKIIEVPDIYHTKIYFYIRPLV